MLNWDTYTSGLPVDLMQNFFVLPFVAFRDFEDIFRPLFNSYSFNSEWQLPNSADGGFHRKVDTLFVPNLNLFIAELGISNVTIYSISFLLLPWLFRIQHCCQYVIVNVILFPKHQQLQLRELLKVIAC